MEEEKRSSTFRKHFLKSYALTTVLIIISIIVIRYFQFHSGRNILAMNLYNTLQIEKEVVQNTLKNVSAAMLSIKHRYDISEFMRTPASREDLEEQVVNDFSNFLHFNPSYYQLRLIGADGQELLKVVRRGGEIEALKSELQNKAHRGYFKKALTLQGDECNFSALNLNMEFGKPEVPFNPVIRVVSAVHNDEGAALGFIALNYSGKNIIESAARAVGKADVHGRFMIINPEGFYIYDSKDSNRIFGNQIKERSEENFFSHFPDIAGQKARDGYFVKNGDLFVFTTVAGDILESSNNYFRFVVRVSYMDILEKSLSFKGTVTVPLLIIVAAGIFLYYFLRNKRDNMELQREVAEYNRFIEKIFSTIPFGIEIVKPDGTIMYQNMKLRELLKKDVVGQKCWEVFKSDGKQCNDCPLITSNGHGTVEVSGVFGDRTIRIYHTEIFLKESRAILEIFVDITNEKQYREELKAAKDAAEASANSKAAFLANMSHEIRTPMNGVVGISDILLTSVLDGEQKKYVELIRSSGKSLLTIINDVLDYSKIEAGKLKMESLFFDLEGVIYEIQALLKGSVERKRLIFDIDWKEKPVNSVIGDPTRVKQVLMNLCTNAVKFTEKGKVVLKIEEVAGRELESDIRFTVTDTGIGIPDEHRAKLFDSFTQADESMARRFGGTGLGLAISKNLVEMMGGSISFSSKPGEGSSFWFTIPLGRADELDRIEEKTESRGIVESELNRNAEILVAEDNQTNLLVITKILEKLGYTNIDSVTNGNEVLVKYRKKRYDVILMDCQMPEMDGFEATWRIREIEKSCGIRVPIIALTANVIQGDRERCVEAGMDEYLPKPVDYEVLEEILNRILG